MQSVMIDVPRRTVSLCFLSYPLEEASERVAIEVVFSNVTSVNTVADLLTLEDNYSAGNVNYWHIAEGPGTSYFYLVEGCLTITAGSAPSLNYN
jgi:hypothetical protein